MKEILNAGKEVIKEYVDKNMLPGACFAYVEKEGFVCDCYGYKSLVPQKEETSLDTIYDIASLSKVVGTSTMISKLMEEGLIGFDTKVCDVLKEFPHKQTTVLNLLVHTAGFPADDKDYKLCKSKEELWDFILKLPLKHEIGTVVEYSCFGYIVLGKIIEHFKGSIEDYAKEVLFNPLNSSNIMYNPYLKGREKECAPTEVNEQRGVIQGIVHDGKANILGGLAGNAGLFSDIKTLASFTMMMLNDGVYESRQVLSKESMERFHNCYTNGLNQSRTMGSWFYADKSTVIGDSVSKDSLFHTGFTGTSIYIDYVRGCGIVLLTNAVHPNRDNNMAEIRPKFHSAIIKAMNK